MVNFKPIDSQVPKQQTGIINFNQSAAEFCQKLDIKDLSKDEKLLLLEEFKGMKREQLAKKFASLPPKLKNQFILALGKLVGDKNKDVGYSAAILMGQLIKDSFSSMDKDCRDNAMLALFNAALKYDDGKVQNRALSDIAWILDNKSAVFESKASKDDLTHTLNEIIASGANPYKKVDSGVVARARGILSRLSYLF